MYVIKDPMIEYIYIHACEKSSIFNSINIINSMNLLSCVDCVLHGITVSKNIEYGTANIIFSIRNFFSNFIFGEPYILINFIIYMMDSIHACILCE